MSAKESSTDSAKSDKFVDATGFFTNDAEQDGATRYPWVGPAFFVSVLIAVTVFFVWFLRA